MPGIPGLTVSGRLIATHQSVPDAANTPAHLGWGQVDAGARYATVLRAAVALRLNINPFRRHYYAGSFSDTTPIATWVGVQRVGFPATMDSPDSMDRRAWCLMAQTAARYPLPARHRRCGGRVVEVTLPAAQQFDLHSLQRLAYRIYLLRTCGLPPPDGYPVFYVLDGNAAFPVAALACILAGRLTSQRASPALVVGASATSGATDFDVPARRRDYTLAPASPAQKPAGPMPSWTSSEGRVKPLVASRCPVDARAAGLFGYPFGGLFVLHVLPTRPAAFHLHVASSPPSGGIGQRCWRNAAPAGAETPTPRRGCRSVSALWKTIRLKARSH